MSNTNYKNVTFLIFLLVALCVTCFYFAFAKDDENVPVYASLFQKED